MHGSTSFTSDRAPAAGDVELWTTPVAPFAITSAVRARVLRSCHPHTSVTSRRARARYAPTAWTSFRLRQQSGDTVMTTSTDTKRTLRIGVVAAVGTLDPREM